MDKRKVEFYKILNLNPYEKSGNAVLFCGGAKGSLAYANAAHCRKVPFFILQKNDNACPHPCLITGVLLPQNHHKKGRLDAFLFCGGAKGSRTPDLLNAIQTRYQLRYNPVAFLLYPKMLATVNNFRLYFLYFLSERTKNRLTFPI